MKTALLLAVLLLSGCSLKTLYPTVGATLGGGVGGALGGPAGGALGAFAGSASGEVLKNEAEVRELNDKVEALSKGDVESLIQLEMEDQKGWFQKTIDGVYDILIITCIATVLYFIFHFWYGRHFAKKLNDTNKDPV